MSKVEITETVLRDAQQSLIATRMSSEEMFPILDKIDAIGYYSIEMWGGATFDAALRFLNEDPWKRLREIRKRVKHTKLQMLLRGQNLVGYKHYPDDVVTEFVKRSVDNGIDIIRIFDALNDFRNIETSVKAGKKAGAHIQGAIAYTISPVHTIDTYVNLAKQLMEFGVDSICIKDMAGLLNPAVAYKLVKRIREITDLPIDLHSHYTTGLASMSYLKAIEAGVNIVDTAISPFSMGTSQPPTESIVSALKNTEFDTKLNLRALNEIAQYFKPIRKKYIENGILDPMILGVDVNALTYQIPGGMLSNLISQLKKLGAIDKLDKVLEEIPRVRKDFGYPPLVTPSSQIVGTQAVMNVISNERYKIVPEEVKAYIHGEYGKPPVEISNAIREKLIGNEKIMKNRPADLLKPGLMKARNAIKEYMEQDEDVLTYALFPDVAVNFFKYRETKKYHVDTSLITDSDGVISYPV